jgi:allophanate hydrolase subunit 1
VALCVELGDEISAEVNTRVRALEYLIQAKGLTGVVETVPSFRSLLVYYDPSQTAFDALCAGLGALAEQATTVQLPPSRWSSCRAATTRSSAWISPPPPSACG